MFSDALGAFELKRYIGETSRVDENRRQPRDFSLGGLNLRRPALTTDAPPLPPSERLNGLYPMLPHRFSDHHGQHTPGLNSRPLQARVPRHARARQGILGAVANGVAGDDVFVCVRAVRSLALRVSRQARSGWGDIGVVGLRIGAGE